MGLPSVTSFTWLDYSEDETRKARELYAALDSESVDALGLGSIRDGFANLLFPGTSTIQTRARYFVLVPYAALSVAVRRPRDALRFGNWMREAEWATMDALRVNAKRRDGVIGFDAGHGTQRLPSEVYWNGMARWGVIRPREGSSELTSLAEYRAWVLSRHSGHEDGPDPATSAVPFFDELPPMPDPFPGDQLNVLPTKREAAYLLELMRRTTVTVNVLTDAKASTLLAAMASDDRVGRARRIFDIDPALLEPHAAGLWWQATGFARIMQGARLLYNRMLCEAVTTAGLGGFPDAEAGLDRLESAWIADMAGEYVEASEWLAQLGDLFTGLRRAGVRVHGGSERFVREWATAAVADPHAVLQSNVHRDAIRLREGSIKRRGTARLRDRAALERWQGSLFGADHMDFRFRVARRHIDDCHKATGD